MLVIKQLFSLSMSYIYITPGTPILTETVDWTLLATKHEIHKSLDLASSSASQQRVWCDRQEKRWWFTAAVQLQLQRSRQHRRDLPVDCAEWRQTRQHRGVTGWPHQHAGRNQRVDWQLVGEHGRWQHWRWRSQTELQEMGPQDVSRHRNTRVRRWGSITCNLYSTGAESQYEYTPYLALKLWHEAHNPSHFCVVMLQNIHVVLLVRLVVTEDRRFTICRWSDFFCCMTNKHIQVDLMNIHERVMNL